MNMTEVRITEFSNRIKIITAICLTFTIFLGGCDNKEEKSYREKKQDESTEVTESGYVLETDKGVIAIGEKAADVEAKIGEPISLNEAPSCAFGDLDKIWTYSDFTLYSYQEDGVDYIYDVVLTSDAIGTAEGVCIGDSEARVNEVYGAAAEKDESRIIYKRDDMKLLFILDGGSVRSIEYASTMLD